MPARPSASRSSFVLGRSRERNPKAGMVVGRGAIEAVQLGDRGDQAKPQAAARKGARGVGAIEAFKDGRQVFRRDARSVVGD